MVKTSSTINAKIYTIENVIRDVKEDTPPPDPTNEKFYDAKHVLSEKFSSTRRWVIILKRFYRMPTKRHRKGLTYYEDSFTGKEAVDYLDPILPKCFEVKNCTRENCVKLLQQFLNEGYFVNVRDSKNKIFKDDASLFKFQKEVVESKLRNFGTLGRPSSIDGMLDLMTKNANIGHLREYKSPPVVATNLCRRKSFSSGTLANLKDSKFEPPKRSISPKLPVRKPNSQTNLKRAIQSSKLEKVVENSNAEYDEEIPPPPIISTKAHQALINENSISHDYEIPKNRRSYENSIQFSSIRSISGSMLNAKIEGMPKRRPLGAVENFENLAINTEIDEYKVWKFCLLEKLERLLGAYKLGENFAEMVEGMDIKWNCHMINDQGFVRLKSNSDELSEHLRRMLRCLTKFPFDDQLSQEIVYKGIELDAFKNVCIALAQMAPIIPQGHAEFLISIVQHFQMQTILRTTANTGSTYSSNVVGLTNMTLSSLERSSEVPLTSLSSQSSETPISSVSGSMRLTRPRTGSFDTCSTSGSSFLPKIRNGPYGSLRAIPSKIVPSHSFLQAVHSSPDQVPYIDDHGMGPYTSSPLTSTHQIPNDPTFAMTFSTINSSTPSSLGIFSKNIPLSEKIRKNSKRSGSIDINTPYGKSRMKFDPLLQSRRRLHKLCYYLKKISDNHCLLLDEAHENRYVILERLSQCFIEPSDKISTVEPMLLFAFFLDYHEKLFTVPEDIFEEVEKELQRRLTKNHHYSETRRDSQTPPAPIPYCERIDPITYGEQSRETNYQLLKLLDTIIEGKEFSKEERTKKLKHFKKTYPHLYEQRFPTTTAQTGPKSHRPALISRIRSFMT